MKKQQKQTTVSQHMSDKPREGKVRYALAMWLLGLPLPIILIALVFRGCDW
ncbi:MAG: hypothetical protein U0892_13565 [Pirellulales bacterium]